MRQEFVNSWKRSSQPRKQRKFRKNAPLHTRRKFISAPLSKDLRQKHKLRSAVVRKGDRVKIMRGMYRNHIGKVDRVDTKKERIFIEGTARDKTDGTKSLYPVHPSKVQIMELSLDDKERKAIFARRGAKQ